MRISHFTALSNTSPHLPTGFHLSSHTPLHNFINWFSFAISYLINTSLNNFTNLFSSLHLIPLTIHIRMSSHGEIISPQATDRPAPDIYAFVIHYSDPELREILDHTFRLMTHELKQELLAKLSPGTNEFTQAIDMWITRLNLIKSVLASFPMLIDGGRTSTTAEPLTIAPPADGTSTTTEPPTIALPADETSTTIEPLTIAPPASGTTQVQQAGPSEASITACLERDQYQCIITGRKLSDASGTEVVPIIPFALANHPSCRDLDFWKMLEMFYGSEATDKLFAELLERVNSLENLITLDNSIHAIFNSGALTLTPGTATWDPIPVINDYTGGYWLDIGYPGVRYAEYIQSTKGLSTGKVRILYPWSRITIASHEAMPGHASALPLPSYFALRAFVLSLKHSIADNLLPLDALPPLGASLTPSPLTPVNYWNQYPIHSPTSDSPCADPVLAASAILQALVDIGALESSPERCWMAFRPCSYVVWRLFGYGRMFWSEGMHISGHVARRLAVIRHIAL